MQIEQTALAGVMILTPKRFGDDRGWFTETWNARADGGGGCDIDFVQDNHSMSAAGGHGARACTISRPPHAQDKLVRCAQV